MEEQSGVKIDYIKESLNFFQKCRHKISTEKTREKNALEGGLKNSRIMVKY